MHSIRLGTQYLDPNGVTENEMVPRREQSYHECIVVAVVVVVQFGCLQDSGGRSGYGGPPSPRQSLSRKLRKIEHTDAMGISIQIVNYRYCKGVKNPKNKVHIRLSVTCADPKSQRSMM